MDESKMTFASFSAILDEIFVCTRPDTESVHRTILVILLYQINNSLSIKHCTVCQ